MTSEDLQIVVIVLLVVAGVIRLWHDTTPPY